MRRYLRTPRRYLHMGSRVSTRREGTSACGGSSPHEENVRLHAELSLRTRRMFARMRSWLSARGEHTSACGAGLPPHAEMGVVREITLLGFHTSVWMMPSCGLTIKESFFQAANWLDICGRHGTGSSTPSLTSLSRPALTSSCKWRGTGIGKWWTGVSRIGGPSMRGRV